MRRRSSPLWPEDAVRRAGAFVGLCVLSLYLTAGRGVSPGDESWFLLVAKRVADGDHLYGDVAYSPLPLAVWLTSAPVAVFGAHIAVVEVVGALIWAATALVLAGHAHRASGSTVVGLLAVAALVLAAPPQRNSLYTPLATFFLLVALVLATRMVEEPTGRLALLAGAAAGLAFASKQTIGLGAFGALLVTIAFVRPSRRTRCAAAALAGFGAIVLSVVLVLVGSGDFGEAIRQGFTGKGEYVAYGSLSYPATLRDAFGLLGSEPAGAFDNLLPLIAPLVAVALVAAAGRRALSRPVLVPALFAAAAVAAAYPRFSATHLAWANAAVIACAASAIGPTLASRRSVAIALAVPLTLGCGVALSLGPLAWANGELTFSSLPSFSGAPIQQASEDAGARLRRAIRPGEEVFFVTENAGFFTLVTRARNPTPYDVPAASNIGRSETAQLVKDVRAGRIRRACFAGRHPYPQDPSLRPLALERALVRLMPPVADLGPCVLHVRASSAAS